MNQSKTGTQNSNLMITKTTAEEVKRTKILWVLMACLLLSILVPVRKSMAQNYSVHVFDIDIQDTIYLNCVFENRTATSIIIPSLTPYFEISTIYYGRPDSLCSWDYSVVFMKDISKQPFGHLQWCYDCDTNYKTRIKKWVNNYEESLYNFILDTIASNSTKKFTIKLNKSVAKCLSRSGNKWQLLIILDKQLNSRLNEGRIQSTFVLRSNLFRIFKPNIYRLYLEHFTKK